MAPRRHRAFCRRTDRRRAQRTCPHLRQSRVPPLLLRRLAHPPPPLVLHGRLRQSPQSRLVLPPPHRPPPRFLNLRLAPTSRISALLPATMDHTCTQTLVSPPAAGGCTTKKR